MLLWLGQSDPECSACSPSSSAVAARVPLYALPTRRARASCRAALQPAVRRNCLAMPALSLISHHDPSLHQTCPTAVVMSTSPLSSPSDARAQRKVAPLGPPAPPERSSVAPLRAKRKLSLSPESSPVLDADLFDPDLFPDAQIDDGEEPVAHLYTSSGKRQQRTSTVRVYALPRLTADPAGLAVQPHVPFVVGRHPRWSVTAFS
jgi:hypothetical protein